jgi:hypothetical protein
MYRVSCEKGYRDTEVAVLRRTLDLCMCYRIIQRAFGGVGATLRSSTIVRSLGVEASLPVSGPAKVVCRPLSVVDVGSEGEFGVSSSASASASASASFSSGVSSAEGFGPPVLLREYERVGRVIWISALTSTFSGSELTRRQAKKNAASMIQHNCMISFVSSLPHCAS